MDIYTKHNDSIDMPDFLGVSIYDLEKYVDEKGFEYEIIDSMSMAGKAKGIVLEQDPPVNAKVKPGRKVYLTVTTVLPEKTIMPNLIDLSIREAQSIIECYGLKLGRIEYVPDIAQNAVLKQKFKGENIAPGTVLTKGSTITLVLGRGKSDEFVAIPNLTGKSRREAIAEINSFKLTLGAEYFGKNSDSSMCKVVKQEPSPTSKTTARAGTSIELWYK